MQLPMHLVTVVRDAPLPAFNCAVHTAQPHASYDQLMANAMAQPAYSESAAPNSRQQHTTQPQHFQSWQHAPCAPSAGSFAAPAPAASGAGACAKHWDPVNSQQLHPIHVHSHMARTMSSSRLSRDSVREPSRALAAGCGGKVGANGRTCARSNAADPDADALLMPPGYAPALQLESGMSLRLLCAGSFDLGRERDQADRSDQRSSLDAGSSRASLDARNEWKTCDTDMMTAAIDEFVEASAVGQSECVSLQSVCGQRMCKCAFCIDGELAALKVQRMWRYIHPATRVRAKIYSGLCRACCVSLQEHAPRRHRINGARWVTHCGVVPSTGT